MYHDNINYYYFLKCIILFSRKFSWSLDFVLCYENLIRHLYFFLNFLLSFRFDIFEGFLVFHVQIHLASDNAIHCGTAPLYLAQYHIENRTQGSYFYMILIQVQKGYIYAYIRTYVATCSTKNLKKLSHILMSLFSNMHIRTGAYRQDN